MQSSQMTTIIFLAFLLITSVLLITADETATISSISNKELSFFIDHELNGMYSSRSVANILYKLDGKQSLSFGDKNGVFEENVDHFKSLLSSKDLYKLKIRAKHSDDSVPSVITSIPACELQKSGFKEDLSIYLDDKKNVVGVVYSSPAMTLSRSCDASKVKDQINFQTRFKIVESVTAQAIPTQAIGPRPGNLKEVRLDLEGDAPPRQPTTQTFLRKYWYIVVVLMIYLFMGGSDKKEAPAAPAK